ncbi:MAG: hypothetical protein ACJ0UT_09805 [Candidatus Latescibacterota bacterium]
MVDAAKSKITQEEAAKTHNPPIIRRPDNMSPEVARFANLSQMVFHPTSENPTEPNAGILTYGPGGGFLFTSTVLRRFGICWKVNANMEMKS